MRDIQTNSVDSPGPMAMQAEQEPDPNPAADQRDDAEPARPAGRRSRRRWWLRVMPEVVTLALCGFLWVPTSEFTSTVGGPGPAAYPRLLIGLLAVTMVARILQEMRGARRDAAATAGGAGDEAPLEEGVEFDASLMSAWRVATAILLAIGYVFATVFLGWVVATFVFTVVFLLLAGKRNLLIVVPLAGVIAAGMAFVFVRIVYISLPTGIGPFDLFHVWLFELMGVY